MGKIGIYRIINILNCKCYIGSSSVLDKRIKDHFYHLKRKTHKSKHLQDSYNKYGLENFTYQILELTSLENLIEKEDYWINYFNSRNRNYGYNIDSAKETSRGHNLRSDTIEKMRSKQTVKIKQYTKDGTFIRIWNSQREVERKLGISSSGIVASCKGNGDQWSAGGFIWRYIEDNFDKHRTEKKIHKRKIRQYDLDNNFVKLWNSIVDASKEMKVHPTSILACCKNKQMTCKNFIWKYENELKVVNN